MGVQSAAKRRRRQAKNRYNHLAPKDRPNYKRAELLDIHAAIAAERRKAARIASANSKKK